MTIETVAIIGAGLIGQSWAALFLAHGLRVQVQDTDPTREAGLHEAVRRAWPDLCAVGVAEGEPPTARLSFTTSVAEACTGADFVQECGPDRIDVKRLIVAEIEATSGKDVVIASSTSSLLASEIQHGARHPGRIVVAHPFNPPHLVPLVELVPGRQTAPQAMATARAFYDSIGREVVELKRDVVGHVANRLSSALFREAVHLVAEGIASVEDVDRAVRHGPGLRWALMGPYLTYHMGGGAGGFRHYMDHLGPTQAARWAELGNPVLDDATKARLIAGVDEMLAGVDDSDLVARRDSGLVGLLKMKAGARGDGD
ncbi:3-hydroxyacyl-CoA dehydrogenase NAD-binding domain-containing protein [Marimonas arenosa]|uniref:3-hydroxyacyl-CoA dehydrogenase NAD-binding domain-containing protein n=1 Tax=Marimonas arenosa TaxID=1795305 RepID=A0AAE3WC97_9RHOB|nr:3-hydroxyacyl-CoA dehydrogenase NAD-binding domain-containing protein [Marimonas arenosa]MDQ2089790.1 3-hydroxyacyl-CoA dehydrogenase NAD-binding domain-containing protein [Marimonas arenosa]